MHLHSGLQAMQHAAKGCVYEFINSHALAHACMRSQPCMFGMHGCGPTRPPVGMAGPKGGQCWAWAGNGWQLGACTGKCPHMAWPGLACVQLQAWLAWACQAPTCTGRHRHSWPCCMPRRLAKAADWGHIGPCALPTAATPCCQGHPRPAKCHASALGRVRWHGAKCGHTLARSMAVPACTCRHTLACRGR